MSSQPVRRQAQPSVEELIKEYILSRDLRSGDKLPTEKELANELGASRGAVREAVSGLHSLGIIDIRHGLGMYVRDFALTGLADSLAFWGRLSQRDGLEAIKPIAEVRDVLETNLIGRVIDRLTAEDLLEMEKIIQEMRDLAGHGQHAPDADRRFHEALYRPLDNWVLVYLIRAFWDAYTAISTDTEKPRRSPDFMVKQHEDILDALTRRDPEAARVAMSAHFNNVLRRPAEPAAD